MVVKASQWKDFLRYLEEDPVVSRAAKKADISRATVYRKIESNRDFRIKMRQAEKLARRNIVDLAESKLIQLAADGHFGSIKYILESNSDRYRRPRAVYVVPDKSSGLSKERRKELEDRWEKIFEK